MRLLFFVILSACGAHSPSFKAADCDRFRYKSYNVLACDDVAVGRHCRKIAPLTDSGKPVDYNPRACYKPSSFGRKATVFIGRSYLACLPHETCHHENPNDPAMCELLYPCVGDSRTK